MTRIWLSQRLARTFGRDEVAALLGPAASVAAGGPFPPAGTDLAVANCFEHPLLDAIAAQPAELAPKALVVVAPPGIPVTGEVTRARAQVFATASTPAQVAAVLRSVLSSSAPGAAPPMAAWQAPAPSAAGVAAPAAEPAAAGRRHLVAKVLAAAALVVALGVAFAVALPGVGPASSAPASAGATTATSAPSPGQERLLACLAHHGVDVEAATSGGVVRLDPADPTVLAALDACARAPSEVGAA
jgi:hypothetical protein